MIGIALAILLASPVAAAADEHAGGHGASGDAPAGPPQDAPPSSSTLATDFEMQPPCRPNC